MYLKPTEFLYRLPIFHRDSSVYRALCCGRFVSETHCETSKELGISYKYNIKRLAETSDNGWMEAAAGQHVKLN